MKCADNVGLDEFTRPVDGAVDMTLSGKIDDGAGTVLGEQSVDQRCFADVSTHKNMPFIILQTRQIFQIACIGELVEIDDKLVVVRQPVKNEVSANKPSAAGDYNTHLAVGVPVCCV